jgi:hypothetical protein
MASPPHAGADRNRAPPGHGVDAVRRMAQSAAGGGRSRAGAGRSDAALVVLAVASRPVRE